MSSSNPSVEGLPPMKHIESTATAEEEPNVILYYSTVRTQLLKTVKPKEKPLRLKLSTRDFRVTHKLDSTDQMEDLLENMRPSFWPKKQKGGFQRRALATKERVDSVDSTDSNQKQKNEYISTLRHKIMEIPLDATAVRSVQERQASKPRGALVDRKDYSMSEKKQKSSAAIVEAIVHGWVEEGSGEHIPEVRFTNPDRTVLSQLEKGTFRSELPPRTPFYIAADTSIAAPSETPEQSASMVRASSAPLERSLHSQLSPEGTMKSLASTDDSEKSIVLKEYMTKITNEPIRSYRAFFNATVPPDDKPVEKPRKLLQGSKYYERKLKQSQHQFDHLRFKKQVDIETFTSWRGQCRGVVSATFAANEEKNGPLLEQQLEVYDRRDNPHLRSCMLDKSKGVHYSVWTTKAMHLAVAEERNRICQNIENFKLDFNAATLSKEAMESLRRDVLLQIRNKPCLSSSNALFSKQDFIQFLSNRNKKTQKDDHLGIFTTDGPIDVVDAMRSPAEAAFAKYVLSVLPI